MKTVWAEMKASHALRENAGEHLGEIIHDSLGHELGKQAFKAEDVKEREVPLYDEDGKQLAIVTQFYGCLHIVSDDDLAAIVRMGVAAREIAEYASREISDKATMPPFFGVPLELIRKLQEAVK